MYGIISLKISTLVSMLECMQIWACECISNPQLLSYRHTIFEDLGMQQLKPTELFEQYFAKPRRTCKRNVLMKFCLLL